MTEPIYVREPELGTAWLRTVLEVAAQPERRAFHTVTRILASDCEGAKIRLAIDNLLSDLDLPGVETVANTIFPRSLARLEPDAGALAKRYVALYPTLKRLAPTENQKGTYFSRLVDYPGSKGRVNQLERLIGTLRKEVVLAGPKTARYEVGIHDVAADLPVSIFDAGHDTSAMAFPCLSFLSFQLDHGRLHAVAHYRAQYLVQRGYGNYLGISRLLGYIADQAGLTPGVLTVVAGRATADRLHRARIDSLKRLLPSV